MVKNFGIVAAVLLCFGILDTKLSYADGSALLQSCKGCHSPGMEVGGPSLVGQPENYLYFQLRRYQKGRRVQPKMKTLLNGASDTSLRNLARYFAALNPCDYEKTEVEALNGNIDRGRVKSFSCEDCHSYAGMNSPKLEGQHTRYLVQELSKFRTAQRPSDVMVPVALQLSEQDIADLAAYYNSVDTCGK